MESKESDFSVYIPLLPFLWYYFASQAFTKLQLLFNSGSADSVSVVN